MEEQPATPFEGGLAPLSVLPRFLVGRRDAIVAVANSRCLLLLGGLFCLSAGFAREYDREDLFHEPWHLGIPLAAPLATSFCLYCLLCLAARRRTNAPLAFGANYRRFLSLYWMTARLAWLYASPVEQFLSPGGATRVNLWLLAIVAAWRVVLITRCASVLFGASFRAALMIVMLFADSLVLAILWYTPMPLFNIMGGIGLTESESIILETRILVGFIGTVTLPIWVIGSVVTLSNPQPRWTPLAPGVGLYTGASGRLWVLAAAALLVWGAILPYSQPPQQLMRQVESHFERNEPAEALRLMAQHDHNDFPANWNPPPWPGYGQDEPSLSLILAELIESDTRGWVRDLYLEKLLQTSTGIEGEPSTGRRSMTTNSSDTRRYSERSPRLTRPKTIDPTGSATPLCTVPTR